MDRWTFSYNGSCTAMNGPSGLQLADEFTDRITGDERNTLSSPKVDLWWYQNQGFSPAKVPRITPRTWCALLHKIPVLRSSIHFSALILNYNKLFPLGYSIYIVFSLMGIVQEKIPDEQHWKLNACHSSFLSSLLISCPESFTLDNGKT